jgi:iron complex outermembrane receptor protein
MKGMSYGWLLCALSSGVMAADQPGLSEKDFLGEVPIVLSVSRLPQPLNEAPGAVTIIDRELIHRSGAREIADVLRLVPGFQTTQARGGNPIAAYHGAFFDLASRVQVLVDGRSVYSPHYTGSASIGMRTVSLEDIERIEVLRGSNSATYGARAALGVINIITRDPAETRGTLLQGNAGQNDILDGTARHGWGDERASYRLTVDSRGDSGFTAFDRNRLNALNFRGDIRASSRDTIELRAGGSEQKWSDGAAGTTVPPHNRSFDSGYLQADWRRAVSADEEIRLSVSHNHERYYDRFFASVAGLPPLLVDFGGDARVDAIELNHRFSATPGTRISWGAEWREERARGAQVYGTTDWLENRFARLYGNLEWRLHPALLLNAGAMLEDSNVSGTELLPRVMLNWLVSPEHTFRAGVSRANRPPSIFERAGNQRLIAPGVGFVQNWLAFSGISAEELTTTEIGYYGDWRPLQATLDVRAFHERIGNFMRLADRSTAGTGALNPTANSFANARELTMRGIEYQAGWRPTGSTQLMASQSFVDPDFPIEGEFLSVPRVTGSLAWLQRLPAGWDFTLAWSHVGAMTWSGTGGMLPPHDRVDLRLARALRLNGARVEAAIVVQNLGGSYPEYQPGLEFGRAVFGTLRIALD